jgi:signal transduction histidine kinase
MTAFAADRTEELEDHEWERWQRMGDRGVSVAHYVLLAVPSGLSLVESYRSWGYRLTTLAIAALALLWILVAYTLPQRPSFRRTAGRWIPVQVHFVVLLGFGWWLANRSPFFIGFVCIPMIIAAARFRGVWVPVGIAMSSVAMFLNRWMLPEWTLMGLLMFGYFVVLQISTTGIFGMIGAKTGELAHRRHELVKELRTALEENAGLHAQLLVQAREAGMHDERQRMAREIHDTLAQGLTGIIAQLEAAQAAKGRDGIAPEAAERHLVQAQELARSSLTEARRSVHALSPGELTAATLPEALSALTGDWSRRTGTAVRTDTVGEARALHPEIEGALFRVAQEALANVHKHGAGADRVGVTLTFLDEVVLLDILDNGAGFDPATVARNGSGKGGDGHGYGLTTMEQRVRRVAGQLEIESAPGQGTAVSANVPAVPAG